MCVSLCFGWAREKRSTVEIIEAKIFLNLHMLKDKESNSRLICSLLFIQRAQCLIGLSGCQKLFYSSSADCNVVSKLLCITFQRHMKMNFADKQKKIFMSFSRTRQSKSI